MGRGRDTNDLCLLTLGTGVGGGIVLNGRIWHGFQGMAGEVGHINIYPDGLRCGCNNRGCLEQYASATAVIREGRKGSSPGTFSSIEKRSGSFQKYHCQGGGPTRSPRR